MLNYYTSVLTLCWMALGVMCILVWENGRLQRQDKQLLCLTYLLIGASAFAEWCGVQLDGRQGLPGWLLQAAKCADYILTPMAGGALAAQMRLRNRWLSALIGTLAVNTAVQAVAVFNGWMFTVDAQNHYEHGPLFPFYLGICVVIVGLVIVEFIVYGKAFRRQNRVSLCAIMVIVLAGIWMQEGLAAAPRTAYLALTLGAVLMFIHYSEYSSMAQDERVGAQQVQINTDALTGVYSRYAYTAALNENADAERVPRDLIAVTVDINGLKQVNDRLGHEAGDELIRGAAWCVEKAMGPDARCFRTGGDEFVVLGRMSREQAGVLMVQLQQEAKRWSGSLVDRLSLSAGYAAAADHPGLNAEKLVREADLAMYAAKAAYYRENGVDRRRARE